MTDVLDRFSADGRTHITVAFGCTGGKHRSVAAARPLLILSAMPDCAFVCSIVIMGVADPRIFPCIISEAYPSDVLFLLKTRRWLMHAGAQKSLSGPSHWRDKNEPRLYYCRYQPCRLGPQKIGIAERKCRPDGAACRI